MTVSAILPARNEAATVAGVVRAVLTDVDEVVVVDSCSTDDTAERALAAGARVVRAPVPGKHHALRCGILAARGERLVFADADLITPPRGLAQTLLAGLSSAPGTVLAKAGYSRSPTESPTGAGRLTSLCARPLLAALLPELAHLRQPLSGEYAVRRADIEDMPFSPGAAVDLGILLHCARRGKVVEVDLGVKQHKHRSIEELTPGALEVTATILRAVGLPCFEVGMGLDAQLGELPSLASASQGSAVPGDLTRPAAYDLLSPRQRHAVDGVIDGLSSLPGAIALVWGGSSTVSTSPSAWNDIDLWLVAVTSARLKPRVKVLLRSLSGLRFVHDAGHYPWFGELLTAGFFDECSFAIDIGLCTPEQLSNANPGPRPYVVWGDPTILTRLRPQAYRCDPDERLWRIAINLLKIRKDISRGHCWNALEYLTRARRDYIGLLMDRVAEPLIRYTRPERAIESRLGTTVLERLRLTHPVDTTTTAILSAAAVVAQLVVDWSTEEGRKGDWWQALGDAYRWYHQSKGMPDV